jgi:hypothetical protein
MSLMYEFLHLRRHGSVLARLVYLQQRTYLLTAGTAVQGQCTKSLRSSPLRGGKSREAVAS